MRAELQHLFGVDLDDVWEGRVTTRHAVSLLGQSARYGDSLIRENELDAVWTPEVAAIAHLFDLVAKFIFGDKYRADLGFPRPKVRDATVPSNELGHELYAATTADFVKRGIGGFMNRVMNPA